MKFIAICGRKRSGKDTTADIIAANRASYGYMLSQLIKEALVVGYYESGCAKKSGVTLAFEDFDGHGFDREAPILISNSDAKDMFKCAIKWLNLRHNLIINHKDLDETTDTFKNSGFWSIRRFMQTLGTDIVVDQYDEQYWGRKMVEKFFDVYNQNFDYFIVKDVRHEHELSLMRSLGAIIIFVERDDINTSTDTHRSENGLIPGPGDHVIKNNGTLQELEIAIKSILEQESL